MGNCPVGRGCDEVVEIASPVNFTKECPGGRKPYRCATNAVRQPRRILRCRNNIMAPLYSLHFFVSIHVRPKAGKGRGWALVQNHRGKRQHQQPPPERERKKKERDPAHRTGTAGQRYRGSIVPRAPGAGSDRLPLPEQVERMHACKARLCETSRALTLE